MIIASGSVVGGIGLIHHGTFVKVGPNGEMPYDRLHPYLRQLR